tara:strand:- start:1286 stop:2779 length:1494 start_codon:yes stop_codon:yes gene_type:complete
MSNTIHFINDNFKFEEISLAQPNGLQGGAYFTKLVMNNAPLYIQSTRCLTKQGIVRTAKKTYCDLMFDGSNSDVVEWFETLEKQLIDLIYEKRNLWFHTPLEREDIESQFASPIRVYKSGKYYLVRVHVSHANILNSNDFNCYDEDGLPVKIDKLSEPGVEIIPLFEVQGVKFSSRSFACEIALKQAMVLKKESEKFNTCLITKDVNKINSDTPEKNTRASVSNAEASNTEASITEASITEDDNAHAEARNTEADASTAEDVSNAHTEDDNVHAEARNTEADASKADASNADASKADASNEHTEDGSADASNAHTEDGNAGASNAEASYIETITANILEEETDSNIDNISVTPQIVMDTSDNGNDNVSDNGGDNVSDNSGDNSGDNGGDNSGDNGDNYSMDLEELQVNLEDLEDAEVVQLRQPNEVYTEIWREARKKAKIARKAAIEAYLEAKNIQSTYMIGEIDVDDSDDDFDSYIEKVNLKNNQGREQSPDISLG